MPETNRAAHWEHAYFAGDAGCSWRQDQAVMSLRLLEAAGVVASDSLIDVGGGASVLIDGLLDRGFTDVTVLDISATATGYARSRLGRRAVTVQWLTEDLLTWQPRRTWQVWHDRAVYHFLTSAVDQQRYREVMAAATAPGAIAVLGCFAPDGPAFCSGLPVARYDAADLAGQLAGWVLLRHDREEHRTPAGVVQPFTWVVLRRQS